MKKLFPFIIFLAFILFAGCGGKGTGGVAVEDSWGRAAKIGENSAVYLKITNGTGKDVQIVAASSDLADKTELHRSMMDSSGTMKMMHQDAIPLPAGKVVEFKPGDYHIMLIGLTRDLNPGERVSLTLRLDDGQDITFEAVIR